MNSIRRKQRAPGAHTDFSVVREDLLREVAERGRIVHFDKGATLIREGDQGDTLFIILSGKVKVFSTGNDGKEVVLDTLGSGETVGEMALDHGQRTASVVALAPTVCSAITRAEMLRAISANPEFAMQLIARLIHRTRIAIENVKQLALLDVYGRVVAQLQKLAPIDGGLGPLTERLSQQALADRVGASRDMVRRVLNDLQEDGFISVRARTIEITKPLPLRA